MPILNSRITQSQEYQIMFDALPLLPTDPLLGLILKFRADPNPQKVDLGVGVYMNEQGKTPVLNAVKKAETHILQSEASKAYVGPAGNLEFSHGMAKLCFGEQSTFLDQNKERMAVLQTPGGCGALRVGADVIMRANQNAAIWVSDPTWANHIPLLGDTGLQIKQYPYFDMSSRGLCFDKMINALEQASKGDLVLLHACCHNPSGADLDQDQWRSVIELCKQNELIPFIDMAYQGFGEDIDRDAFGLRLASERLPQVVFAVSCSKNFGLYRERVGCVGFIGETATVATRVHSHMMSVVRGMYSMPPSHGAMIVAEILASSELNAIWQQELLDMKSRIISMREQLVDGLANASSLSIFDHMRDEKGMFSFLQVSADEVKRLAEEHSIYMAESGRINFAGLNSSNISRVCEAVASLKS